MKRLDYIIYRAPHAALITSGASLLAMILLFTLSGSFQFDVLPTYYTSFEQLLGSLILLILMPPLLFLFLITGQRRSMYYGRLLVERGILDRDPDDWLRPTSVAIPVAGSLLGLVYALTLNTPLLWLTEFSTQTPQARSIVIGQSVLWIAIGLVLSFRLHTAFCFNKIGRTAHIDLLDVHRYEPFARNGVNDVMAIALLFVLSTLQSLDAQFRFENYSMAILVGLPAAIFLFVWPMLSIHLRLARRRAESVAELDRMVAAAPHDPDPDSIRRLELLLQHRDRIRDAATWPIDWATYSRVAVYFVLPPIAWLGGAYVEYWLGRILDRS